MTLLSVETHSVRDGSRLLTFEGKCLANISSQRDQPRWSELRLYKTTGGSYVLEKVGRSVVVHVPGCKNILGPLPRFEDEHPGDDPDVGYWYDDDCVGDTYDLTTLLVETDRHFVVIAEDPAQIVDALYRRKSGARHLPQLSLQLLDQAMKHDDQLAESYSVERLV